MLIFSILLFCTHCEIFYYTRFPEGMLRNALQYLWVNTQGQGKFFIPVKFPYGDCKLEVTKFVDTIEAMYNKLPLLSLGKKREQSVVWIDGLLMICENYVLFLGMSSESR